MRQFHRVLLVPLVAVALTIADNQPALRAERAGQPPASLTVTNEKGKTTAFSMDQLAKLPRISLKAKDHSNVESTYDGVPLIELLKEADAISGKELKGPLVANYLLVEAADGYRAVFSIPEVDPVLSDNVVLLADHKDGKLLDVKEGPFRIIVPRDKLFMRWVRQVTSISVQSAPGKGKQ